ncbi:hypothetical protein SAY87_022913 [Trapa incisa]|uniref:Uncharacterized protein n=1 Tax=Trapa incisa TaxID=236973 RepID=A0AAN7Q586_9MYRT|nr:hypothetical protein SAY87_022913 [Trapa incisa]
MRFLGVILGRLIGFLVPLPRNRAETGESLGEMGISPGNLHRFILHLPNFMRIEEEEAQIEVSDKAKSSPSNDPQSSRASPESLACARGKPGSSSERSTPPGSPAEEGIIGSRRSGQQRRTPGISWVEQELSLKRNGQQLGRAGTMVGRGKRK